MRDALEDRMRAALAAVVGPEGRELDPLIRPTQDARFGDYQSNVALSLAKRLGEKPRDTAARLVAALALDDLTDPPEVSGPGFINFRFRPAFLAAQLAAIQADPRLGLAPVAEPQRVVVDFSSPNLAKEMHVGHVRSTIIGDCIARLLEHFGHTVLRLNHVGDWGTQFGMLIQHVRELQPHVLEDPEQLHIDDLEAFYVEAKRRFDSDPEFAVRARRAVVDLQSGDPMALEVWRAFCRESLRHCHEIYERLGVRLEDRGESFYNPYLPELVAELRARELAVDHDGAVCFFVEGWTNREGKPLPLMVQKSDGGYNYDTTDLAGIRHRTGVERAARIIYVTDIRQHQHFEMVFAGARKAGWAPPSVSLEHVGFGMILGVDGRPFRTRDGGTIKLKELLDEAIERAAARVAELREKDPERRPDTSPEADANIARIVGLGAVKYADLSHNVTSDYRFDWNTMLALEGNTAPYMLYAYARIRSIRRRAHPGNAGILPAPAQHVPGVDSPEIHSWELPPDLPILLEHPSEVALAKQLLHFVPTLRQVAVELRPHLLTDYLYGLSRAYSTFYDRERGVRIVDAEPESVRLSRLRLCDLTARTLKLGLELLGIGVLEQM